MRWQSAWASAKAARAAADMFFGWWQVGIAFAAHLVAGALGFYALPRLLVPLADEFAGGDRAPVLMLTFAMGLGGMLTGPLVGKLAVRFPLRAVIAGGALLFALCFALASQAATLWQLILAYSLFVPLAASAMSTIGGNALVSNWFAAKRPMAIGISQVGMSLAGACSVFFISWTLSDGGWRNTYYWFAGIALVLAPLLYAAITNRPEERGLLPDGAGPFVPPAEAARAKAEAARAVPAGDADESPESVAAAAAVAADAAAADEAARFGLGQALRDRNLWLVGGATGLCFFGSTAVILNAHAFATDGGFSDAQADNVVALMSIGAALGKLVFGWLGMRFGERAAFGVSIAGQMLALLALPFSRELYAAFLAVALCFGVVFGGVMPSMTALAARIFGAARFSTAMGLIWPVMIPFQISGPPLAAYVRDTTGSYDAILYGFVLASAFAALALAFLRISPEPRPGQGGNSNSAAQ